MTTPDVWYLAGPMTGYPQFNFPAFGAACWALRTQGYNVVSPHEEDPPEIQQKAWLSADGNQLDLSDDPGLWGERLAHDVRLISNGVRGLILLPGWKDSRGAMLECTVALLAGKSFREWNGRGTRVLEPADVAAILGRKLLNGDY